MGSKSCNNAKRYGDIKKETELKRRQSWIENKSELFANQMIHRVAEENGV